MTKSLITLLCAAYLVEKKSLDALREQMEAAENVDVHLRVRDHLVETQWQIKLLEACLEFQGVDKILLEGRSCRFADKVSDMSLQDIKEFEIKIYSKIIAAARRANAPEILQVCREILEQDRGMAEWIEDNSFKMRPAFS